MPEISLSSGLNSHAFADVAESHGFSHNLIQCKNRYIVSDYYSLKFIEFYDIQRRRRCAELLREEGWQSNGLSDSMGGGMNSGMTGMARR